MNFAAIIDNGVIFALKTGNVQCFLQQLLVMGSDVYIENE